MLFIINTFFYLWKEYEDILLKSNFINVVALLLKSKNLLK